MNDISITKLPLWRQGLALFWQHRDAWWKWAFPFLFLYIPIEFWTLKQSGPYYAALLAIIKSGGPDMAAKMKNLDAPNQLAAFGLLPIYSIMSYLFYGFYLGRNPCVAMPKASVGGFFYALGQTLLKFLIMTAWMLAAMLPLGLVLGFLSAVLPGKLGPLLSLPVLVIVASMTEAYFLVRYSLVYPLAVEHIPSSLKASTLLTRGKMWRLAGNFTVIYLIVFPLLMVNMALLYSGFWQQDYWTSFPLMVSMSTVVSLISIVTAGLLAAFSCNACRVLYEEKKQADPSFRLTTQAS